MSLTALNQALAEILQSMLGVYLGRIMSIVIRAHVYRVNSQHGKSKYLVLLLLFHSHGKNRKSIHWLHFESQLILE